MSLLARALSRRHWRSAISWSPGRRRARLGAAGGGGTHAAGYLVSGGEVDTDADVPQSLLEEFRSGKLGRFYAGDARRMREEQRMKDLWEIERRAVRLRRSDDLRRGRGRARPAGRAGLRGGGHPARRIWKSTGWTTPRRLTDARRRQLYDVIVEQALGYGIAMATEAEIDEVNILQATFLAMQRAPWRSCRRAPELVLVDGNRDPGLGPAHPHGGQGGDGLSANIAAASACWPR